MTTFRNQLSMCTTLRHLPLSETIYDIRLLDSREPVSDRTEQDINGNPPDYTVLRPNTRHLAERQEHLHSHCGSSLRRTIESVLHDSLGLRVERRSGLI